MFLVCVHIYIYICMYYHYYYYQLLSSLVLPPMLEIKRYISDDFSLDVVKASPIISEYDVLCFNSI